MRKNLGLFAILLGLMALTYAWERGNGGASRFMTMDNWKNLLTWVGLFGILSLGQSLVIITGGIDLSAGSVVCLVGVVAAMLMDKGAGWHPAAAIPASLALATGIGLWHGLMITRMRMQPFVVTLCGLFIYRGIARLIARDTTQGFGTAYESLRWFGKGTLADLAPGMDRASQLGQLMNMIVAPFLVMLLLALLLAAFLHASAPGRHLFALGANEEAARFSGIATTRLVVGAYVACTVISAIGGLLLAFKVNSLGPSDFGSFYELYAIAGAVLGGCSLRGGTGNVLGIMLGIALIFILRNLVNLLSIPSELEYVVIGGTILLGVCVDELLTRRAAARARVVEAG